MDISSLSSQLNISTQELRAKAKEKGFFISPRANKIDNALAKKILEAFPPAKPAVVSSAQAAKKQIKLPTFIKVRDFAQVLNLQVVDVIRELIKNGVMATINEEIDFDTASIVAGDLGFEVEAQADTSETHFGIGFMQEVLKNEKPENLKARPPIVAIMGHVDHGKTTLLDTIRKTKVAEGESGGITQHVGAYHIKHQGKIITFLDTPGHEAFSEMRARGANVTDIIVLVIAADDGVRPQPLEVINRAKFSNTPLIVAINKIDKPEANVIRAKQELAGAGVLTEEWGGKTIAVEISAKQNKGIDTLLEMILLTAELENFTANPIGKTMGTVIESKIMQGKGATATVIVQNGTLKPGDIVAVGAAFGRIRSLEDETGKRLKEATPSTPVQVSGLSETPQAGDILQVFENLDEAKQIAIMTKRKLQSHKLHSKNQIQGDLKTKSLNLVIKADVAGSLEAIKQAIAKLKNDEVKINILTEGVGEVTENDVLSASAGKGVVLNFRNKVSPRAENLAKQKNVSIDSYEVIYELLEDVTTAVIKLFTPETEKFILGKAKILAVFRTEKSQMIVGGRVEEGQITKISKISIIRGDAEIGKAEIEDLQHNKVAAKSVHMGEEFGIRLKTPTKIAVGDLLESYEEKIKVKTL